MRWSITNDWEGASASSHRVEQSGIQHGSVCILDEVKLERETKQLSEMVDRRENEAQSDQMKADGRGTERSSDPFRASKKNPANQTSSQKTPLSRSTPVFVCCMCSA